MISFEKIEGPLGIPVYYQYLPEPVRSVSMSWSMFAGAADDESVGRPGLYHWFEHVPFRGTRRYPGGAKDIKAFCSKYGGTIGASTGFFSTTYHTTVPKQIWQEALSRITDLMSQPLLEESSINAEREIIFQEIARKRSDNTGRIQYELPGIIWPGHPLGHPIMGTEESLKSMGSSLLRDAHNKNYDASRCVLFVVGNIGKDELFDELAKESGFIPNKQLPKRRTPHDYGALPKWHKGEKTTIDTDFTASTALFLFSLPDNILKSDADTLNYSILGDLFAFGTTSSPIMRVLREERSLVYGAGIYNFILPQGGYWGFVAETQNKNVEAVIQGFKDVMRDEEVCSEKRINEIKTGLTGAMDIRPIDPNSYRQSGVSRLSSHSRVYRDQEYLEVLSKITTKSMKDLLDSLNPNEAHTIIFKGKDK